MNASRFFLRDKPPVNLIPRGKVAGKGMGQGNVTRPVRSSEERQPGIARVVFRAEMSPTLFPIRSDSHATIPTPPFPLTLLALGSKRKIKSKKVEK